jgi:hypothetical protein
MGRLSAPSPPQVAPAPEARRQPVADQDWTRARHLPTTGQQLQTRMAPPWPKTPSTAKTSKPTKLKPPHQSCRSWVIAQGFHAEYPKLQHLPPTGHRPGFPRGVPQTAALTPNCWEKPRGDSPVYQPRTARPRAPCQLCQNSQAHTLSQHGYGALAQLPTRSSSQNGYGASPELVMSPL